MEPDQSSTPRSTPWLKTPTQLRGTLDGLSWDGVALWHTTRMFCASVNNRGMLPKAKLAVAVARRVNGRRLADAVEEMLAERLWVDHGDRWELVDFAEENPSAEEWTDPVLRERLVRGRALKRNGDLCKRIKNRDRNLCRYCGIRVNWNNKRGGDGGTYDHVDPDGENTFSNVVVACRACNGRKRDRTPEQAGMPLLRPGTTLAVAASSRAASAAGSTPAAPDEDLAGIRPGFKPDPNPNQPDQAARARDRTEPNPNQIGSNRVKSEHPITDLVSTGLVGSANPGPTEDPSSSDQGGRARADD